MTLQIRRPEALRKNVASPGGLSIDGDPKVAAAFQRYVEALQDAAGRGLTSTAATRRTARDLVAAIPWGDVSAALKDDLQQALAEAATRAGRGAGWVLDNPYAQAWARTHAAELVTLVNDQTKAAIRQVVGDALELGVPPREAAAAMRGLVGVNEPQAQTLSRMAERMWASGASWDQVAMQLQMQTRRMIAYRSMMIARTELTNAQAHGLIGSWQSARDAGFLPETAVQEWIATPESPRTSDICRELHGKLAPIGGSFYSAVLGYSVDAPAAHPNCRSTLGIRILTPAEYRAAARRYGWSTP